jgi:hypothetical protein
LETALLLLKLLEGLFDGALLWSQRTREQIKHSVLFVVSSKIFFLKRELPCQKTGDCALKFLEKATKLYQIMVSQLMEI